jgi:hypothetical protein
MKGATFCSQHSTWRKQSSERRRDCIPSRAVSSWPSMSIFKAMCCPVRGSLSSRRTCGRVFEHWPFRSVAATGYCAARCTAALSSGCCGLVKIWRLGCRSVLRQEAHKCEAAHMPFGQCVLFGWGAALFYVGAWKWRQIVRIKTIIADRHHSAKRGRSSWHDGRK